MDVQMPDGTVVRNVPDGTTRAQLQARLSKQQYGAGDGVLSRAGKALHDIFFADPATRDKTLGDALKQGLINFPKEVGTGLNDAIEDFKRTGQMTAKLQQALSIFGPAGDVAAGAPLASAGTGVPYAAASRGLSSFPGRAVEQQTGVKRDIVGQGLTMALPFVGKGGRRILSLKGKPTIEAARQAGTIKGEAGPILEPAKSAAEKPQQTAWRWADAENRLETNDEASKMEVRHWVDDLDPKFRNPVIWQRVYDEIEQRLIDPTAKLSPEAQEAFDKIKPFEERARAAGQFILDWKRDAQGADTEILDGPDQGYAHRVVEGHGDLRDEEDPAGSWQRDPIMSTTAGRGSLSRFAPSVDTSRKFFVLQGEDGTRTPIGRDQQGDLKVGEQHRGSDGKMYTVKQATTKEVEANTPGKFGDKPVRYHKNYAVNTIQNMLRNERVANNLRVLDGILTEMRDLGQVWRERWKIGRNEDGTERWAKSNSPKPEGYIETKIPELKGHYFPPDKAKLLDAVFRGDEEPFEAIAKVNRVLNGSLFWQPIGHQMNVLSDFTLNRSWAWLTPGGYGRLMVGAGRALRALVTQNADYVRFMREGGSLHYPSIENKNFYEVLLGKFGETVRQNPTAFDEFAKSIGMQKGADVAKALSRGVKAEYRLSSKAMWGLDDFLKMTRYFEEMQRGKPIRQAISDTEKDMASYRVVPQIMRGQNIKQIFKSPLILSFGRYTYAKLRSISLIMRDLAKGTKAERVEASGKLAVIGAMYFLIQPLFNAGARYVTGNQKATVPSRGAASIPQRAANYVTGSGNDDYAWQKWIDEVINLSPAIERSVEFATNRYFGTGRTIVDPKASPMGKAAQRVEWPASFFGPTNTAMQAIDDPKRALARQFGISIPYQKSGRAVRRERRAERFRESKDDVEKELKELFQ